MEIKEAEMMASKMNMDNGRVLFEATGTLVVRAVRKIMML
jgi:hypothetical protein